ncbi:MAG: hypothetical protein ACIALR_15400, partial [Blastopirellula sp. JB062]
MTSVSTPAEMPTDSAAREDNSSFRRKRSYGEWFRDSSSFLASLIFHMGAVILLALLTIEPMADQSKKAIVLEDIVEEPLERPLEEELDQLDLVATEMSITQMTNAVSGLSGAAAASLSAPQFETEL